MPPWDTKTRTGIKIVRDTDMEGRGNGAVLFINRKRVRTSQTNIKLLACLYDHFGQVVTFQQLCLLLGYDASWYDSMELPERHVVRQYMFVIKHMLAEHKARCTITFAEKLGYALCELPRIPSALGQRLLLSETAT